jgi:membrane-associated phospholipid phosphatase
VIEVQPGGEVLKNKDLWERTGYFHPFLRMPKYMLSDQKNIWTSPFHTAKKDIKWWVIFGGATGALIATDRFSGPALPNTNTQVRLSNYSSNVGSAYSLIPISAGFYFLGTAAKSERFRETGLMCFESLIDTTIISEVVKSATKRARPLEADGNGGFGDSNGRLGSGFPSGHAINTWAMASIFAHQYRQHVCVPIIAYTLASTVVVSRVGARKHFPGDAVAGAAMGWFIGDFVYGKRHNENLDAKHVSVVRKAIDHVNLSVSFQ